MINPKNTAMAVRIEINTLIRQEKIKKLISSETYIRIKLCCIEKPKVEVLI